MSLCDKDFLRFGAGSIPVTRSKEKALAKQVLFLFPFVCQQFLMFKFCPNIEKFVTKMTSLKKLKETKTETKKKAPPNTSVGHLLYYPKAVHKLLGAVPDVQNNAIYGASEVSINADDHSVIWMVSGDLCDRYLPIGAIPIEAEQIGEQVAVATHTQRVASVYIR